jgi:cytochrome c oxidase subunit 2
VASKKGAAQVATADESKTFDIAEMMTRGEQVHLANCAACHQANGAGIPGAFPAINGSKVASGPIEDHVRLVMNGRPGTAMAAFADQLSDADIAAVITYQRNAWDNKSGDMAQPVEIAALRSGAESEAGAPAQ